MRNLPGSRTCSKAALFSSAQLPETDVTVTTVDLLLSRFVTLSLVPCGNWLLDAAGAPASPESVTVEPGQTTFPAGATDADREAADAPGTDGEAADGVAARVADATAEGCAPATAGQPDALS
jgi:hypothetical protein